jgi:AraC-like DNA-binding protein
VSGQIGLFERAYAAGDVISAHAHAHGQLTLTRGGIVEVLTPGAVLLASPNEAVWIPSGVPHALTMRSGVDLLLLYVGYDSASDALPERCAALAVSPLLKQLCTRVAERGGSWAQTAGDRALHQLVVDEIAPAHVSACALPLPHSPQLTAICKQVRADPARRYLIEEIAAAHGISARTLARLFKRETGVTYGEWNRRFRIAEAIARLGDGQPITTVALDLGYETASAFAEMFRKQLGVVPSAYARPVVRP